MKIINKFYSLISRDQVYVGWPQLPRHPKNPPLQTTSFRRYECILTLNF